MQKVSDAYLLNLLREVVSIRAGGKCEFPGCNKVICDPHHIFSRDNKSVRYDKENIANLCDYHHRWAEAHRDDFVTVMIGWRGEKWWDDLVIRKNIIIKFNGNFRQDWKEKLLGEKAALTESNKTIEVIKRYQAA